MFDESSGVDHRTLIGHSGPVYGVSFSPDKFYVVSGSEDGTSKTNSIKKNFNNSFNNLNLSSFMVFINLFLFSKL